MFHIGVSVRNGLAPLLAVLIALAMPAAAQVVNYADFTSVTGLTLNGNASQVSSALRLTPSLPWQRGSAFLSDPIVLRADASFCTQFAFRMPDPMIFELPLNPDAGADGIVFAIQKNGNNALGANGGYLGYFRDNSRGMGTITTGVGVEFDSWNNGGSFGDPDGNHVAIDINGAIPSLASAAFGPKLNDGTTYHAWVDYNGVTKRLEAYLSQSPTRPNAPTMTYTIDLASSLGGVNVFPGFTSATGMAYNTHDLLSWRLSTQSCVPVDLKPGSNPNCVNPKANGVVSVAILKTDLFDPNATLKQDTIKFGGASALGCSPEDADADGDLDLTCRFKLQEISWPAAGSNCGIVALTADTTTPGTTVTSYAMACLAGEASCNAGTAVGSEYIAAP